LQLRVIGGAKKRLTNNCRSFLYIFVVKSTTIFTIFDNEKLIKTGQH